MGPFPRSASTSLGRAALKRPLPCILLSIDSQPSLPVDFRYSNRKGTIVFRYQKRWRYLRRIQFLVKHEWRRTRRYRGKIRVFVGGRYRLIRFRGGRPAYRVRRRWRRISYRYRKKGQRSRRQRRRRFRRKRRRIRRNRRRNRRRIRRLRRYRRRTTPFKIYYRGKTRKIFKWKGRLTFRLGGRRRRIR